MDKWSLKLRPYLGATLDAIVIDGRTMINLADPRKRLEELGIFVLSTPLTRLRIPSAKSIDSTFFANLFLEWSKTGDWYIVSRSPVLPVLVHIISETNPNRIGKEIRMRPNHESKQDFELHSEIDHASIDEYMASVTYKFHYMKRIDWPILSAALFSLRFVGVEKFVARRSLDANGIYFSIQSETDDGMIENIERYEHEFGTPYHSHETRGDDRSIGPIERTMLAEIYASPLVVRSILAAKEPLPTEAWIEENRAKIASSIDRYARDFRSSVFDCHVRYKIPPISSEETYRFVSKAEMAAAPLTREREFIIERKKDVPDPLFDKIANALEVKGKQISVTYEALLDVGQIFTYDEVNAMGFRFQMLARR